MLLGIDIGGSGLKVAVYSPGGDMTGFAFKGYSFAHPQQGWAEIDPRVWWEALLSALREISEEVDLRSIRSVGISGTNATLGVDRQGRPVMPALMFNDQRGIEECRIICDLFSQEELVSITGNRAIPGSCSASSILWLKRNKPEAYEMVDKFLHPASYLLYRLTGHLAVDRSRASPTLLYDMNADQWSPLICDKLGIEGSKLPDIRESDEIIGAVSAKAAAETGLCTKAVVVTGGNDTACAALGLGITRNNMAGESAGTATVLLVDLPKPLNDPRIMNMPHVLKGHYLAVAPMTSGGSSLEWFRREFCREEETEAKRGGADVFEALCALARNSPPGANGLIFLPYLAGERAPLWDPHAKGVFFGLTLSTSKSDFARAILESSGNGTRWNISIIEDRTGQQIQEIVAAGGQTKSEFWRQLKADITGKAYMVPQACEAAALGAAILAGKAVGVELETGAGRKCWRCLPSPDPGARKAYQRNFDLYKKLYFDLKQDFLLASSSS